MSDRPREHDEVEDLLDDLPYLWEAQGPSGQNHGRRALEELLWRWGFLDYDYWKEDASKREEMQREIDDEVALLSIAVEAERRGYEDELVLLDKTFE
jgi:hypothetical protein